MEEPPTKRLKLDVNGNGSEVTQSGPASESSSKYIREVDVGITEFINRSYEGFDCILKYR